MESTACLNFSVMKTYRDQRWIAFRNKVIARDNHRCTECGLGESDGKVLQVHHLEYIEGHRIWEVPLAYCVTLCKGCHAAEHGIIPPKTGWDYIGREDLEDLVGSCEYCGTSIRYEHEIWHKQWGVMIVGSHCSDQMTGTKKASIAVKRHKEYKKLKSFLESTRWKPTKKGWRLKRSKFFITCWAAQTDKGLRWKVNITTPDGTPIKGNKEFDNLLDAKEAAFKGYIYLKHKTESPH